MLDTVVVHVIVMMKIHEPLQNASIHAQYVGFIRVLITIPKQGFTLFVVTIGLHNKSKFAFLFKNLTHN